MKLLIISILALMAFAGEDGKCRAIVMSGGGDKGSYQMGVLTKLMELLDPIETQYEIVSGVSVGNLNGMCLASYPIGQEKEFSDFILYVWRHLEPKLAYKKWPEGILASLKSQQGFLDGQPLRDLLDVVTEGKTLERYFISGSADMNTGSFRHFEYPVTHEPITDHMKDSVLASSSMPGVFPPVERDGDVLLDGGVVWRNDAHDAIDQCRTQGYADEDIIVDWIVCAQKELVEKEHVEDWHTFKHGMRAWNLQSYYGTMNEIERTTIFFPDVNFRYVIGPSENLNSPMIPIDLRREHLDECIEIGQRDAIKAVELGEGGYLSALKAQF